MSRTKWIFTIVLAATLILVPAAYFAQAQEPVQTVQNTTEIPLDADVVFAKVNNERAQRGLKPLVRDARLDQTAQQRADDMVARNYFSHYDPVTGKNLVNISANYPDLCITASENIIAGRIANDGVVDGWMGSTSHREALLRSDYTATGVAIAGDTVVQHFCAAK